MILLNGVMVGAYGGLGPGLSTFVFTPGGPEVPQLFLNSCCEGTGQLNAIVSGPFVSGLNTLEFIINNTGAGIFGNLTDQGPSRLSFEGCIGPPPQTGSVPEPATWAMILVGFFGLGSTIRWRRRAAANTARELGHEA